MGKKEELARQYSDWLHKEVEEYYGRKCDPKDMYFRNGDIRMAYIEGWDSALKHQWTIPSSRETIPNPKIVLEKGVIALLSNGRIQYQKDMRGFYWEEKDEKFVYNYSDVVAWMYAPSVDEVVGGKE